MQSEQAVPTPIVTIVMPFHDTEAFIDEAIASCVAQRLTRWELVCIDDRSTDGSRAIVEGWVERDPRVRLLSAPQGNRGPGRPRNLGIDAARGRYLAFLDSDDRLDMRMLERLVARAERDRLDIAMGAIDTFDDGGRHHASCRYRSMLRGPLSRGMFRAADLGPRLLELRFSACNKVYNTAFVREQGLRFGEDVFYEDLNFTFQAMLLAGSMGFDRRALYLNRKGRQDATTHLQGDRAIDAIAEYERFAQFLAANQQDELLEHFHAFRFRKLLGYLPRTDVTNLAAYHRHLVELASALPERSATLLAAREQEALALLPGSSAEELLLWSAWQERTRRKSAQREGRTELIPGIFPRALRAAARGIRRAARRT
jgi:glycosyltransferase involved in cell wall biosynthesis